MCRECRNRSVADTYSEVLRRDAKAANALMLSRLRTSCANMNLIVSQYRSRSRLKPRQCRDHWRHPQSRGSQSGSVYSIYKHFEDDQRRAWLMLMESMKTSALQKKGVCPHRADHHAELRGLDATSVKVTSLEQRGRKQLNREKVAILWELT